MDLFKFRALLIHGGITTDAGCPAPNLSTPLSQLPICIAYFGDGTNEAQLVYNFSLPPLTLHSLQTGDATALTRWAQSLALPSERVTWFNFLASHDGIGVNPARGILSEAEIDALVTRTLAHGGFVSCKHNADGSASPYELNINYLDALSNPAAGEPPELAARKFLTRRPSCSRCKACREFIFIRCSVHGGTVPGPRPAASSGESTAKARPRRFGK